MSSFFVTGTDTGVGKTFISRALLLAFRQRGLRTGAMKPCETGCEERDGALFPADAELLRAAAGGHQPLDLVCPSRSRLPMAPAEAAALEGGAFSIERAAQGFRTIQDQHDVTLVEGAGGLLVPLEGDRMTPDLVRALDLPLLMVARAGLGTINHSCMSVACARAEGLRVLGIVFSRDRDPALHPPGPDEAHNPAAVARIARVPVLGRVPWITSGDPAQAIPHLDVDAILAATSRAR